MEEMFSFGVKIELLDTFSKGFESIAAGLEGLGGNASELARKLVNVKIQLGKGLAQAAVGGAGLMLFKEPLEAASEYESQLARLRALGFDSGQMRVALSAAMTTSQQALTSSVTENLELFRELHDSFEDSTEGASKLAAIMPTLVQGQTVLESISGKKQAGFGEDVVAAINLRHEGGLDQGQLLEQANLVNKSLLANGGAINARELHQAIQSLGPAAAGMSDKFVYQALPVLMKAAREKNGKAESAGSMLAALDSVLMGKKKNSALWQQAGLLDPASKNGAVVGAELLKTSPLEWASKYLGQAEQALMKSHQWTQEQANEALFGKSDAGFAALNLVAHGADYKAAEDHFSTAKDSKKVYDGLVQDDPILAKQALLKQLDNAMAQLGDAVLPILVPVVVQLAQSLSTLGEWMQKNKLLVEILARTLLGLAAAMAFRGGVQAAKSYFESLRTILDEAKGAKGLSADAKAAAGSMSRLTGAMKLLGGASAVAQAGMVGYQVGSAINDGITSYLTEKNGGKQTELGSWIYEQIHGDGSDKDIATSDAAQYKRDLAWRAREAKQVVGNQTSAAALPPHATVRHAASQPRQPANIHVHVRGKQIALATLDNIHDHVPYAPSSGSFTNGSYAPT